VGRRLARAAGASLLIGTCALTLALRAGTSPARSATAPGPIRAAFYDSGYPTDWTRLGTHYSPSAGFYGGGPAVVRRQIGAMRRAGIVAGIADWQGPGSGGDRRVPALLAAARGTGFRWALRISAGGVGGSGRIRSDLALITRRYGASPAYLRWRERPVVFVAGSGKDCAGAARWVSADAPRAALMLTAFPGAPRCTRQPAGWYEDDPGRPEAGALPWSFTISPGRFPAARATPALARNLGQWRKDVRDMVASGADFQLVDSFNDWGAGTAVESAREWTSPSGLGAYLDALQSAGATPAAVPAPIPAPPAPVPSTADPVVAAAGDIACDPADPHFDGGAGNGIDCQEKATSDLLFGIPDLAAVLTLGDTQYETGALPAFMASFDPTWGRLKALIHPAIGNHELGTPGGAGYFSYFGAAAGPAGEGWYSFDVGAWHLIVLNGNCPGQGGCALGGPQETWLRNDLATHPAACTLAYWHQPRFSSGEHGDNPAYDAFWRDLYAAGAEIVLNGHDHDYERFAPQTPDGAPDPLHGIREFVVGTGGRNHYGFTTIQPNSEVRDSDTFGVLELTLHPSGYDWSFVPEAGKTFTDAGSGTCHGPTGPLP